MLIRLLEVDVYDEGEINTGEFRPRQGWVPPCLTCRVIGTLRAPNACQDAAATFELCKFGWRLALLRPPLRSGGWQAKRHFTKPSQGDYCLYGFEGHLRCSAWGPGASGRRRRLLLLSPQARSEGVWIALRKWKLLWAELPPRALNNPLPVCRKMPELVLGRAVGAGVQTEYLPSSSSWNPLLSPSPPAVTGGRVPR